MTTIDVSIIAFDNFTDVDVFLTWDLLKRIKDPVWNVRILGESSHITSMNGLTIPTHGPISEANQSNAVIFASGPGTRVKMVDSTFLSTFKLNPDRQLIGSMCSGALILGVEGGKRTLFVPSQLGYGDREKGLIKHNSKLIFHIELIEVRTRDE